MLAAPGAALAAGPLAGLDGYWVGTGRCRYASGTKERMRCKAQYAVNAEGSNLQISLTCDSDTYNFHVNSYANATGGSLLGQLERDHANVSGQLSAGPRPALQVRLNAGGQFGASMAVTLKANQLAVSVTPNGTSVASVTAALNRAR